jgi:glycerophosphoryl diester phosphodiesterase
LKYPPPKNSIVQPGNKIEIHGHRGARGYFPENTLTAFLEAVKIGVDFLEMDVVVSKDNKIVVSHEAWMNPGFCLTPEGKEIEENSRERYNLFKMDHSEIIRYDCGRKTNKDFPLQKPVSEYKPLLSKVVTAVDAYTKNNHLPSVNYNIEIKSEPGYDGIFNPAPAEFVDLVYEEIKKLNILNRVILQSFDTRILRELKKKDASLILSLLVENTNDLQWNLNELGFMPDIYAPEFVLIDEQMVKTLTSKNIKLITWTVNEVPDIKKMIELGVEGIISDYPDRVKKILNSK